MDEDAHNDSPDAAPKKIGVILDGNRRWAKSRGMSAFEGHREGYRRFKDFLEWAGDARMTHVVAYAFSTENWNRVPKEVDYLMDLLRRALGKEIREMYDRNIRLLCVGDRTRFPEDIQGLIGDAETTTAECTGVTVYLAISYGGHAEILDACRRACVGGCIPESEEDFARLLWVPIEPDLIIRTGGEERLSNFLSWQSAYSELFFTGTLWPDFTREEFQRILVAYKRRQRRFGV